MSEDQNFKQGTLFPEQTSNTEQAPGQSAKRQKLLQMQALPLEAKIEATKRRIREWLDVYPEATVSFSGGKDSTVLLDIARQVKSDIVGVFSNTGLEYPEVVAFVEQTPNIQIVRPKLDFLTVVQKHGYPVISKKMAQYIHECQTAKGETATKRLRLTGFKTNGEFSPMGKISNKWQFLAHQKELKIGEKCCHHLKKTALLSFQAPIIGVMAGDSNQRQEMYCRHGCNAFNLSRPRSNPMAFWTEADVWEYLRGRGVPYSKIYDLGYDRTGCMFCMFGLHLEPRPNRFERMAVTHPQLFRYCMDGPLMLREVIRTVYKMEMPA